MKKLYSQLALLVALALSCFSAGFVWMTDRHHVALPLISPDQLSTYDVGYEALTESLGVPIAATSALLSIVLLVLRHPRLPWWLPATGVALQISVWFARTQMWGDWADQVRHEGVRLTDGALHPAQLLYVESHWIRIALLTSYCLLVLAMLVVVSVRGARRDPAEV